MVIVPVYTPGDNPTELGYNSIPAGGVGPEGSITAFSQLTSV
jgi:hypothetical protein